MGLDIGILGSKELADPVNGKLLDLVDNLTATVVAFPRIALCILVGKTGSHGLHHFVAHEILTRDKLHALLLAKVLLLYQIKNSVVFNHGRYI